MKERGLCYTPLCVDCHSSRCVGCRKKVLRLFKNKHHERLSEFFDLDDQVVMIDVTFKSGFRILVRDCEVSE